MAQGTIPLKSIGLANPKFDTALNLEPLRNFQREFESLKSYESRLIKHHNVGYTIRTASIGVKLTPRILRRIIAGASLGNPSNLSRWLNLAHQFLAIQEEHLLKNGPGSIKKTFAERVLGLDHKLHKIPQEIANAFVLCSELDKLIQFCRDKQYGGRRNRKKAFQDLQSLTMLSEVLDLRVVSLGSKLIIDYSGFTYLASMDQFLMIQNKAQETLNVLLISWLFDDAIWSAGFYKKVIKGLEFMYEKVIELDNDAYTIFKNFDGIASGVILEKEELFDNSDPLEDVMTEMMTEHLLTRQEGRMLRSLFDGPAEEAIELSAISKLAGHPDIQTLFGIDKLRRRTYQNNPVSHKDISYLICSMKKGFIHQYYLRHRRWPVIEVDSGSNPRILYCRFRNIWITDARIPSIYPPIELKDFEKISLGKVKEFDYVESQFQILKDTALAATRSHLMDPLLHKVKDPRLRRTLLYFLVINDPRSEVLKHFFHLDDGDPAALEYMVIKLTQKERELKLEGRFFGQSPYVERARRCILEQNVSKLLTHYNASQGMTLNELQKLQKLYVLSRFPRDHPQYLALYISVDVEAFNNNFRRSVCEPVGKEFFNKLFGVKHYTHVMDTFECSQFEFTDGVCDYTWRGQYGGIEGLFQKYWTWMYEAVASRVAEMTGFNNFIMVNGDDLRVILLIPQDEIKDINLKEMLSDLAESFKTNYEKFGFKFKINETYFATNYLGFGKLYLYNSYFCSMTLKKGAKVHGLANLMGDYPLEYIKGVMSETLSTTSYSVNHRFIYLVGIVRVLMYLDTFSPNFSPLSDEDILCLLFWPANFGGLPILSYLRCTFKGDSDNETIWISLLRSIHSVDPDFAVRVMSNWLNHLKVADDYCGLAANPYSLPNDTPSEGLPLIKQFIRQRLSSICENTHFLRLLIQADEEKTRKFIKALFDCSPIPAKALSVIYSTSAAGQIDEFLEKFTTSKSVGGFLSRNFQAISSIRVLRRAKLKDLQKIEWMIAEVKRKKECWHPLRKEFFSGHCSTVISDQIREWCYRKPVVGVTYPCIAEQITVFDFHQPPELKKFDYLTFWRAPVPATLSVNYSHGPHRIFLGNHTHLKLLAPDLELSTSSPGLQRVSKLLKVYTMLKKLGPQCENFVKKNLSDLTGIQGDLLTEICYKHTSGSVTHRVPANHWSPLVAPNDLSNRSSYIKSTTQTDRGSKTRTGDMTINYGLIRAHVNLMIFYSAEFSSTKEYYPAATFWAKISDCPTCTFEVTDQPVEWLSPIPDINFNLADNVYATLSSEDKDQLTEMIQKYKETRSYKAYEVLSNSESLVRLAQEVTGFNLLNASADTLRTHFQDNDMIDGPEEDLATLTLVSHTELANLTDLKCLPCSVFMSSLMDYLLQWYIDRYSAALKPAELINILNVHNTKLPLRTICAMLIESGYWPVLYNYLKEKNENPFDLPGSDETDPKPIQIYLLRYCIHMMTTKALVKLQSDEPYIVPITKLPDNDHLDQLLRVSFDQLINKILVSWVFTSEGQDFQRKCEEGDLDGIKFELEQLTQISISAIPSDVTTSFPIFRRNIGARDYLVLSRIFGLCGGTRDLLMNTIQPILDEVELEELKPAYLDWFRYNCQFVFLPAHQSTEIIREIGGPEFKKYYQSIKAVNLQIQEEPSPASYSTSISSSGPLVARFSLEGQVEPGEFSYQAIDIRLRGITEQFKTPSVSYLNTEVQLLQIFGGMTGKLGIVYYTMAQILRGITTNPNKITVVNDPVGTVSAAFVLLFPKATIINLTHNPSSQENSVRLPDLAAYMIQYADRLDYTSTQSQLANFFDSVHFNFNYLSIKSTTMLYLRWNGALLQLSLRDPSIQFFENLDRLDQVSLILIRIDFGSTAPDIPALIDQCYQRFRVVVLFYPRVWQSRNGNFILVATNRIPKRNVRFVYSSHGLQRLKTLDHWRHTPQAHCSTLAGILKFFRLSKRKMGLCSRLDFNTTFPTLSTCFDLSLLKPTFQEFREECVCRVQKILEDRTSMIRKIIPGQIATQVPISIKHLIRTFAEGTVLLFLLEHITRDYFYDLLRDPASILGLLHQDCLLEVRRQLEPSIIPEGSLDQILDNQWTSGDLLDRYIPLMLRMLSWAISNYDLQF